MHKREKRTVSRLVYLSQSSRKYLQTHAEILHVHTCSCSHLRALIRSGLFFLHEHLLTFLIGISVNVVSKVARNYSNVLKYRNCHKYEKLSTRKVKISTSLQKHLFEILQLLLENENFTKF